MSPNAGGGGNCGVAAKEYSCGHGAQINFGDLTPYLSYDAAGQKYKDDVNVYLLHAKSGSFQTEWM